MRFLGVTLVLILCWASASAVPAEEAPGDWEDFASRLAALNDAVEQLAASLDRAGVPPASRETAPDIFVDLEVLHRWFHREEARSFEREGASSEIVGHGLRLHATVSRLIGLERAANAARPADRRPRAPTTTGSIAGTVIEDGTFVPLDDVLVEIYDASGDLAGSGLTAADGTYGVTGLATGTYFACTVNQDGYFDERYDNQRYASLCSPTSGTPIPVTEPLETGGIDFGLSKGGTIAGLVEKEGTSIPLEGVLVDVYDTVGRLVSSGLTDASGIYSSGALATGSYYACTLNTQGYIDETFDDIVGCVSTLGTAIPVTEPAETSGVDFELAPGGTITGDVTHNGTTNPLAGVIIEVYDDGGTRVASGSSAGDGSFSVDGLPSGTYYVCTFNNLGYLDETYDDIPGCVTTSGTPVGVTAPAETSGIDFGLAPGGVISGAVTEVGTGTPLATVFIDVHNAAGAFLAFDITGADGSFDVGGLLPGTYFARTSVLSGLHADELFHNIPCSGSCVVTTGTPITVIGPGTPAQTDFALNWLTGCKPALVLDGPPVDDVGLVLEGCDTVTATGPFGVEAPGSITVRGRDAIVLDNGFFVATDAACTFELTGAVESTEH